MSKNKVDRLIYSGKSNFKNSFIVRIISDSGNNLDSIKESAVIINKKNVNKFYNYKNKNLKLIILSGDIIKEQKMITEKLKDKNLFWLKSKISLNEGDVVEVEGGNKGARLFIIYRVNSDDNTLIPTNACNNKCLMCALPQKILSFDTIDIKRMKKIIRLIDAKTKFLGISGGEPTLLKDKLVNILALCKDYLPNTKIYLLSNGRMFSYVSYVHHIDSVGIKHLEFGIPLHSHKREIHDKITQTSNSFDQTMKGVINLLSRDQIVELRVVIQKNNVEDLENIATFIINNLYGVRRVCFVGMEMSGMAVINKKRVWIPYGEIKPYIEKAIIRLLDKQIKVNIFNIPRCKLDEPFRSLCMKSISDYKIRFLDACRNCKEQSLCSGIFVSSLPLLKKEGVNPIA